MSEWYRLDENKNPVPIDENDIEALRESHRIENRIVSRTKVYDGCEVSTVFLGLDHSWSGGPPLLFETMVFGGPFDGDQDRYSTWAEAVAGHARYVDRCQPIMTEDVPQ